MLNTYSYVIPKVVSRLFPLSCCLRFRPLRFPRPQSHVQHYDGTLFLPQVVLNVPQYLLYNKFGWIDNPLYPALGAVPVCYRDLLRLPAGAVHAQHPARDLDEAAAIDGCAPVKILYKIICPMLSPSLVACALFQFMWSCNDFMGPLLYVTTPAQIPHGNLC